MTQTVIAIVSDCDDTLAPDTTGQLLARFGVDPTEFYEGPVGKLVDEGFDPAVAYMNEMIRLAQGGGRLGELTREKIEAIGKELEWFPGVPQIFSELEREVQEKYGEFGIRLEEYVISGGIADLLRASPLGEVVNEIWGCNFAYDGNGVICGIRNVVSFTEKTRFLFAIEKGLVGSEYRNQPYSVNVPMESHERRVPLRNMIYLGDGPSDIPCMSVLQPKPGESARDKGFVIGILNKKSPLRTWALGYGRRANITVPPDFSAGEHARAQLRQAVVQLAERIRGELHPKTPQTPTF